MPPPTISLPTLDRWTEQECRLAIAQRCTGDDTATTLVGHCEGCGIWRPLNAAHRIRRSQGGLWHPANVLGLCGSGTTGCHGRAHHDPVGAAGWGWELTGRAEPTDEAAWIRRPWDPTRAGWHLLRVEHDADGIRRHVVIPVEARWVA